MPTATYEMAAVGNDGYVKRTSATRATGGTYASTSSGTLGAGTGIAVEGALRNLATATDNFVIGYVLGRWNTATLPDGTTPWTGLNVTQVQLQVYATEVSNAGDGCRAIADWYDFGGVADAADWLQVQTTPNALSVANGPALSAIASVSAQTLTFTLENIANFNKAGFTGVRLGLSEVSGAAPVGVNRILVSQWATAGAPSAPAFAPRLLVDYSTADSTPPAAPTGLTATV